MYRRQDEAGTPFGVTVDFDTLGEKGAELKDTVTLRDRDTMKQTRVKIDALPTLLLERILVMAFHVDSSSEVLSSEQNVVPAKGAPTLYAIIFFKLAKGILFFFFGLVLYFQAHRNLPQEYADLLKKPIFQNLRIHPENKLVQHIADQIADLTEERIKWAALGTMAWSLLPSVEGIGLLFRWRVGRGGRRLRRRHFLFP